MLSELHIKDLAIIDELHVSFERGLNVLSGETGAGKSIIIGAIGLLMGDRASLDVIRSSADVAVIEASFNISGLDNLIEKLQEMELYEGDELLVKRIIARSGKNKVYINGYLANLSTLSLFCELLMNICGQHEHQTILSKDQHIVILDNFGDLENIRLEYEIVYKKYLLLKERIDELIALDNRKKDEIELLRYQLKEINDAEIQAGEDEQLNEEKKLISHVQKLRDYAITAYDRLYGKDNAILEELRKFNSDILEIKKIDKSLSVDERAVEDMFYQLEDVALIIRTYGNNLIYDPHRLDVIEERLELLGRLKRKYGGSLKEILRKKTELEKQLSLISTLKEEIDDTARRIDESRMILKEKANVLSQKRRDAARRLEDAIEAEIQTLRMGKAVFRVNFKNPVNEDCIFKTNGIDELEFYLSTNIGEELKPLMRTASGGELSRIVLAMKKALSGVSSVSTIIFDEVDSGIGGATAEIIGDKLKEISKDYQVLCITHLPQIACFADRHFLVSKEANEKRINTRISLLSDDARIDEITRMLGGVELTVKTREHAQQMLKSIRGHL